MKVDKEKIRKHFTFWREARILNLSINECDSEISILDNLFLFLPNFNDSSISSNLVMFHSYVTNCWGEESEDCFEVKHEDFNFYDTLDAFFHFSKIIVTDDVKDKINSDLVDNSFEDTVDSPDDYYGSHSSYKFLYLNKKKFQDILKKHLGNPTFDFKLFLEEK